MQKPPNSHRGAANALKVLIVARGLAGRGLNCDWDPVRAGLYPAELIVDENLPLFVDAARGLFSEFIEIEHLY